MKITWQQIRAAEDAVQRVIDDRTGAKWNNEYLQSFFAQRPHLLFPLGYDEYVPFDSRLSFGKKWLSLTDDAKWSEDPDMVGALDCMSTAMLRRPTGQWLALAFAGANPSIRGYYGALSFHTKETFLQWVRVSEEDSLDWKYALEVEFTDLFKVLYRTAEQWCEEECRIWTPQLWTPDAQERTRISLRNRVERIIRDLKSNTVSLADLTWQQFEDLVAELLRSTGMDIYQVKESPQGGRDLLARGELIPGEEPVTISVEVKHKPVVYRPEVDMALWQNRHFPALLFVTSGRFSAGVLLQKRLPELHLRLFLKDGIAIGDLLWAHRFGREGGKRPWRRGA